MRSRWTASLLDDLAIGGEQVAFDLVQPIEDVAAGEAVVGATPAEVVAAGQQVGPLGEEGFEAGTDRQIALRVVADVAEAVPGVAEVVGADRVGGQVQAERGGDATERWRLDVVVAANEDVGNAVVLGPADAVDEQVGQEEAGPDREGQGTGAQAGGDGFGEDRLGGVPAAEVGSGEAGDGVVFGEEVDAVGGAARRRRAGGEGPGGRPRWAVLGDRRGARDWGWDGGCP